MREEPFMARRKHLTETAQSGLGQATAGGVAASAPTTEEVILETSSARNEAPIAEAALAPQNPFSDLSGDRVMETMDRGEMVATEQRATATASTAEKPGNVRNPIVTSGWPRAVGWGGYRAIAFYYGYGYPYCGFACNAAAYSRPGAGYGHGYYGLGFARWY
jgi:hypothetical protein